ncbi:MAG: hypothetical protein KKA81_07555 [Bacteroidetes bacterium]|nr:hypothetical protein [Bacteroidota bacterium]
MRKLYLLLPFVVAVIFTGCQKDMDPVTGQSEVEVSFTGVPVSKLNLKSDDSCFAQLADYAKVVINGTEYFPEVFYLEGVPYTTTLKLNPGAYNVEGFFLYDDNQTPGLMDDDYIIAATPEAGSDYASFVTNPVTFSFNAVEFEKAQVYVEVVCFEPDEYELFGFNWFVAEEIMIREQCFFGDICVSDPDDYIGSLYENQSAGLQIDMPAIFKIEVWRNGEQNGVYGNEEWLGEGQPTCVLYGDYLHYTDVFEFKLYILVKVGTGFDYVHFKTWTFEDDEEIEQGTDGLVDFVLGSCFPDADWVFPAYMNLPLTVTYKIIEAAPGDLGGYVDAELSDIPAGYDIFNGVWASWCFDHQTSIIMNWPYSMNAYNSLYPDQLPVYTATDNWDNANWLMNHLDWYSGYEWYDIQGALWLMDDPQWNGGAMAGVPALADMVFAQQMYNDAMMYGENFLPLPGEYAAVVFVPAGTPGGQQNAIIQTVFVLVEE